MPLLYRPDPARHATGNDETIGNRWKTLSTGSRPRTGIAPAAADRPRENSTDP